MSATRITNVRDPSTGSATSILLALGAVADDAGDAARELDGGGAWLAPGLIDLQLNGAFGADFSSDPAAAWVVGERLAATGVTAFLPTIVSSPLATYDRALDAWAAAPSAVGAVPLGWHFEGPMLSPARAGAHDPAHLRLPDGVDSEGWSAAHGVRMVTLAPELPGALDVARRLTERGVVVSTGHTDAAADCAEPAIEAGTRYATHLMNAMRGIDARDPGIAAGLLVDARVTLGVIADGHHLADTTLCVIWQLAHDRLSLVSDGIAAFGLGPGICRLGGGDVHVAPDGSARRPDGRLAGAVCTLPDGLRRLRATTGASLAEALRTVTEVPATLLGLEDRGHLRVGARADAVLLDDELSVLATFVAGELIYARAELGWA